MTFSHNRFALQANQIAAVLAWVSLLCFTSAADATLITDSVSSGAETTYDGNILNNDLIENGSSAVKSVSTTGTIGDAVIPESINNWLPLTDGLSSSVPGGNPWVTNADAAGSPPPSITFSFDTDANPLGYKLTSIRSIYGWNSSPWYSDQSYKVELAYVGNPTAFSELTTVSYLPFGYSDATPSSSQVTLTDSTGKLATGVAAVRFTFLNNRGGLADQYDGQVIREFDVTGNPVPEPNTIVLVATGLLGLLAYAWRKRK